MSKFINVLYGATAGTGTYFYLNSPELFKTYLNNLLKFNYSTQPPIPIANQPTQTSTQPTIQPTTQSTTQILILEAITSQVERVEGAVNDMTAGLTGEKME